MALATAWSVSITVSVPLPTVRMRVVAYGATSARDNRVPSPVLLVVLGTMGCSAAASLENPIDGSAVAMVAVSCVDVGLIVAELPDLSG